MTRERRRTVPISKITLQLPANPRVVIASPRGKAAEDLAHAFDRAGFARRSVESIDALHAEVTEGPDILVVDRTLPDALQACREIKERVSVLPVLVVGGAFRDEDRTDLVNVGVDDWFPVGYRVQTVVNRALVLVRTHALYRVTAEKADRLLLWQDWVRYLVHDLRNPLSVAISNLAFLEPAVTDPSAIDALDDARMALHRLNSMLHDFLDTSRLTRGILRVDLKLVDLAQLADEVIREVLPTVFTRSRVTVEVSGPCEVIADRALVARIFGNLVTNALRYTRVRPVQVLLDAAPDRVLVRVRNDGPAVPQAVRALLFEPWAAVREPGASAGTGLGLAFARLVVDAHGGGIWLESGDDGDVVFAFTLPRTPPAR